MSINTCRFAALAGLFLSFTVAGLGCGGDDSSVSVDNSQDAAPDAGGVGGASGSAGQGGSGLGGSNLGGSSGTSGAGGSDAGGSGGGDAAVDGRAGSSADAAADATHDVAAEATVDSSVTDAVGDLRVETSVVDAASGDVSTADAPSDALADSAADATATCGANNAACSNGGANGLCKTEVCAACADPTDDANCAAAYGAGNLCLGGECTAADCRTNPDCAANANGTICGITQPNHCGKCASDAQCGAAQICSAAGACVSNACTGGQEGMACTGNASDVCCTLACIPGNCCPGAAGDTACKAQLGASAVCSNHTCTTCNTVTGANPVYLVDPVNGNDNTATGSGTSGATVSTPACRFATITRALQAIGPAPASGTTIQIMGAVTVPTAGNTNALAENFPIGVPHNIFITASGGLVTIKPPANRSAFLLSAAASGINGSAAGGSMAIDGTNNTAPIGVVVTTGSTDGTTLRNVTIQNFAREGVSVTNNGILTIREGVTVKGNGTAPGRHPGLHVANNGHVSINVPAAQALTSFSNNTQHGILVDGNGSVNIQGVQTAGVGTIEARNNFTSGLAITQTPSLTAAANVLNGFVSVGTTNGNGIRIEGGSNVSVRNSWSLGNAGSGIIVATSVIGNTRNNVLTNIDLGSAAQAGANTFQATIGSNANTGAGVCLQMDHNAGTLLARGNRFSAGANCAATAAVLTFNAANCGGNRDLGLTPGVGTTVGNDIDVTMCTHP